MKPVLIPDPFLEKHLDKPALTLILDGEPDVDFLLKELTRELGGRAGFVQAALDPARICQRMALEDMGFRLADATIHFEGVPRFAVPPRVDARLARAEDEALVREMAANSLTLNRFSQDPGVPEEKARAIKADWAGNYFAGERGDALYLALLDGVPKGFLLLLRRPGAVVVDLIAVEAEARGQGLGTALAAAAMEGEPGGRPLSAGTSAANAAAMAFYQSLGLRAVELTYHHHLHGAF